MASSISMTGNIVLDRIDAVTAIALEAGAVVDELHGSLAGRAGEDFQKFRIDGHGRTIARRTALARRPGSRLCEVSRMPRLLLAALRCLSCSIPACWREPPRRRRCRQRRRMAYFAVHAGAATRSAGRRGRRARGVEAGAGARPEVGRNHRRDGRLSTRGRTRRPKRSSAAERALTIDPKNVEAHRMLGLVYRGVERRRRHAPSGAHAGAAADRGHRAPHEDSRDAVGRDRSEPAADAGALAAARRPRRSRRAHPREHRVAGAVCHRALHAAGRRAAGARSRRCGDRSHGEGGGAEPAPLRRRSASSTSGSNAGRRPRARTSRRSRAFVAGRPRSAAALGRGAAQPDRRVRREQGAGRAEGLPDDEPAGRARRCSCCRRANLRLGDFAGAEEVARKLWRSIRPASRVCRRCRRRSSRRGEYRRSSSC